MAAYHVVWECVVEQWLGVRRMTHMVGFTIEMPVPFLR